MADVPVRRRLTLAYDGGAYHGWQVQPGRPTVQGAVESALAEILGRPVGVVGASRTDAGVHAVGQVAHVDDPRGWPCERLRAALNARLPADVRVSAVAEAPPDFHARFHARSKTYVYQLHLTARRADLPPFRRHCFHPVRADLDLPAMRAAAARLVGSHDFTALSKRMEPGRSTARTLHAVRLLRVPHGLRLIVTGDAFLYGMVRLLAGLLVEVGRGRRGPDGVESLLLSRDRSAAPALLPAHALILWRVRYGPRDAPS